MSKAAWQVDTFRDANTGDVLGVEVFPVDDLREHQHNEGCACLPQFKVDNRVMYLTHAAFDGRELNEANAPQSH